MMRLCCHPHHLHVLHATPPGLQVRMTVTSLLSISASSALTFKQQKCLPAHCAFVLKHQAENSFCMANIAYTLQGLNSNLGLGDWKKLFFLTQSFTLSSWCFPLLPYASAADCPLASPCPVQRFGLCIGLDQVRDLQLSEHMAEEAAGDDLAL